MAPSAHGNIARATGILAALALTAGGCGGGSSRGQTGSHAGGATPTTTTTPSTGTKPARTPAKPPKPGPAHPKPHHKHGPATPPSLGPQLTVAELDGKADAACKSANARQAALSRPGDFATNPKAAATYLRQLVSIKGAEARALRLNPPQRLRRTYIPFAVDVLREEAFLLVAAGLAQTGRPGYVQQYQKALSFDRETTAPAARQLHLTGCS